MSDLITKSTVLGGPKTVVGDGKSDILLNSSGKIYIKTGKATELLNEIIEKFKNSNNSKNNNLKVIIVSDIKKLKYPGDGYFVLDTSKNILFITYLKLYITIAEGLNDTNSGYVKKVGDTMTGVLTINVEDEAPLIVSSSNLVSNLNVNYLQGHDAAYFLNAETNQNISGIFTFKNAVNFQNVVSIEDLNLTTLKINSNGTLNCLGEAYFNTIGSSNFNDGGANISGWKITYGELYINTIYTINLVARNKLTVGNIIQSENFVEANTNTDVLDFTNVSGWKFDKALNLWILNLDIQSGNFVSQEFIKELTDSGITTTLVPQGYKFNTTEFIINLNIISGNFNLDNNIGYRFNSSEFITGQTISAGNFDSAQDTGWKIEKDKFYLHDLNAVKEDIIVSGNLKNTYNNNDNKITGYNINKTKSEFNNVLVNKCNIVNDSNDIIIDNTSEIYKAFWNITPKKYKYIKISDAMGYIEVFFTVGAAPIISAIPTLSTTAIINAVNNESLKPIKVVDPFNQICLASDLTFSKYLTCSEIYSVLDWKLYYASKSITLTASNVTEVFNEISNLINTSKAAGTLNDDFGPDAKKFTSIKNKNIYNCSATNNLNFYIAENDVRNLKDYYYNDDYTILYKNKLGSFKLDSTNDMVFNASLIEDGVYTVSTYASSVIWTLKYILISGGKIINTLQIQAEVPPVTP